VGFGCIGIFAYAFFWMIALTFMAMALLAMLGLTLFAYLVAFAGLGIDALLLRFSDSYRARRHGRRITWPADVSAVVNSAFTKTTRR
jgi:hypothetical protein